MTPDPRLSKVNILLQQQRYEEAGRLLKDLLSQDANNVHYLSTLAEVYLQQEKYDLANSVIDNAIGLAPDEPHVFYIKARIALMQEKYDEAESYLQQSISLDPYDANNFAMWAHVKLLRKKFAEALELANKSLEIDSENLLGLNTRSSALLKLDRKEESFQTIEGALREDPNNAYTHANYGWGLLEKGDHKKALIHFKEALKHDPNNAYAQSGMVEALKATNLIYRWFLKYSFWVSNLAEKYQWAVIIGFYVMYRVFRSVAKSNPEMASFLEPVLIALAVIALSTWVITPISNLFLRLNKYGRFLLDREEKVSSNFVGGSIVVALVGLALYFLNSDERFLVMGILGIAMMVPFSVMFRPAKTKHLFLVYAGGMALAAIASVGISFSTGEPFNTMTIIFLVGFVALQWIANFVSIRSSNR
jgi:tetratricopeptide (TPR) repeat protein